MLTLCMIVKNEANNLPRCLDSVEELVDEIVIVDTGSTDRTPEIAKSYGARVYHFPWTHNFATARNESLRHAQGDWVLVLDADEVLVPTMMPTLNQAIRQEQAIVINLVRQEVGAIQSPYSLVSRLFRRHPDVHFDRPYHAIVDDSVAQLVQRQPQWQIVDLPEVAIRHYGYAPEAIVGQDKLQKAKATMEGFFADHPQDPYVCSKLGALYLQLDAVQEGIELLQRGLQSSELDAPLLYELHYHLGIAQTRLHHIAAAKQHYETAIQQPLLPCLKLGAYNNLGNLLKTQGDLARAKGLYEKAIQIDPTFAIGHNNLGMTLKALGQLLEAVSEYQQAIALNPDYAEAHQNLAVVLLKLGRVPDSLEHFQQAIALHERHHSPEAARLRQGLQEMGFSVS